jgi:phosphatidylglycerol---prolipoprotein diacylglyceryl transferase
MMALAFVTAGIVLWWQLKKRGIEPQFAYSMVIAAIIGGIVGAKVHFLILHPDQLHVWYSGRGLVWYGGLFGGALAVWLVALRSRHRTAEVADAVAPALALAYAVGRMGCFLNGDDYGKPTNLPWAMSFPKGDPPTTQLVHPTQLYEILASLAIFAILVWVLAPRLKRAGALFWSYCILAGVERFLVEFVRTNKPALLGLTQQQWISILLILAGAVGLAWLYSRPEVEVRPNVPANKRGKGGKATAQAAGKTQAAGKGQAAGKTQGAKKTRRVPRAGA